MAGVELEDRLPANEYLEYYGPDFRLQPPVPKDKPNTNSPEYLEEVDNHSQIPSLYTPSRGRIYCRAYDCP